VLRVPAEIDWIEAGIHLDQHLKDLLLELPLVKPPIIEK